MESTLFVIKEEENKDHIFKTCELACNIVCTISANCSSPMNFNSDVIDWIEHVWFLKNSYHKLFCYPLQKIFFIFGLFGTIQMRLSLEITKIILSQF